MKFEDKATLNILARTSSSVFLLASSIIMVRYLSKEDYGTFLQVMLILNTVLMLTFVGLPHSVYYFYPQVRDKVHLVRQTLLVGVAISVVSAIVVYLLSRPLSVWLNNPDLAYYGGITALLVICQGPVVFRDPILLSQNALVLNSVATLLTSLLNYIPLFTALFFGVSLKGIVLVFLFSNVANLLVFLGMLRLLFRTSSLAESGPGVDESQKQRVTLWDQVRYSFPIGIASYIGIIGRQIDKYIISVLFLPAQFAIYSRGAMEVPLINNLTYTLNDMTMPRYVAAYKNGDIKEFLRLMHTNVDKVAKINFGVFAFLFFEAKVLMEVLYTKAYLSATPVFQVYLFLLFLSITVYGMIPRVTGKTRQLTLATVISVSLNIVISLAMISFLGPVGAAAGTIVGSLGYMIFLLWCASKDLGVSWTLIMPWWPLIRILMAATAPLVVLWGYHIALVHLSISPNFWALCGAFCFYLYGYLAALNLSGALHDQDRAYLCRWLRFNPFVIIPRPRVGKEV